MRVASFRDTRGSASGSPLTVDFENLSLSQCSQSEEASATVGALSSSSYSVISEPASLLLFELYINMTAIMKYRNKIYESEVHSLKLAKYHEFFYLPYDRWAHTVGKKLSLRVRNSFEAEKVSKRKAQRTVRPRLELKL